MPQIISIQILRAFAAISVTICHFSLLLLLLSGRQNEPLPLHSLASGVDLFFVISGFIMVYSSENLFGTPMAWRVFIIRRLARILPLYWATTLIAIPLMVLPLSWTSAFGSFLFIPYRSAGGLFPLHGVGWTLNFEMFFYAIFSIAIIFPRTIAIPSLCISLIGIVFLGRIFSPENTALLYWTDPIILEFVAGMLIAVAYKNGIRIPNRVRITLIVVGAVAVWFYIPQTIPSGIRSFAWGVPAALIVMGTALGPEPNYGGLARVATVLGNSSYALYLVHPLVGAVILRGWGYGIGQLGWQKAFFLGFIFAIILSIFIYQVVERPIIKRFNQLANPSSA